MAWGLLTRDRALGVQKGDGEGSFIPWPHPCGDRVPLPMAVSSLETRSQQTTSRSLKMPCILMTLAPAGAVPLAEPLFSFSPRVLGDTAQGSPLPLPPVPSCHTGHPVGQCLGLTACLSVRSPPRAGRAYPHGPLVPRAAPSTQQAMVCAVGQVVRGRPCPRGPAQGPGVHTVSPPRLHARDPHTHIHGFLVERQLALLNTVHDGLVL